MTASGLCCYVYFIMYTVFIGDDHDERGCSLAAYMYLEGKTHYDNHDKAVYKCHQVAEYVYKGSSYVVVYRRKLGKNGKFGNVRFNDHVLAESVANYHSNEENIEIMNQILGN